MTKWPINLEIYKAIKVFPLLRRWKWNALLATWLVLWSRWARSLFVCQWYVSSLYFFFLVDFLTEYESVHPNLHCPRWSWQWEVCSGGEQLMTQQAHVSRCPCWFMFCVLIVDTHLLTCICLLTSIAFVDKHFDCWHAGSLVNLLLQVVLRLLQDTRCHL